MTTSNKETQSQKNDDASPRLTLKEQAFVDAYAGNGTEAARLAGYEGDEATLAATASRLLRRVKVANAIAQRNAPARAERIACREERQEFWTSIMRAGVEEPAARLRASELLAKSEGDFVHRLEHSGPTGRPIEVRDYSHMTEEQQDARIEELMAKYLAGRANDPNRKRGPLDDRIDELLSRRAKELGVP